MPLRCRETGRLLEGIEIGDIGAKMVNSACALISKSRQGLDNGWIRFNKVRVPRENMLSKWSKVSPTVSWNALLTTAGRIQLSSHGSACLRSTGRRARWNDTVPSFEGTQLARGSSNSMKHALTIAIRYGAVRVHNSKEQILDYQSHQVRRGLRADTPGPSVPAPRRDLCGSFFGC